MKTINNLFRSITRFVCRQRWVRFGIRDRLARLSEPPDTTEGHLFEQPFFGGTYIGHTSNYIDWSSRYFGAYAIEELELLADIVADNSDSFVAIDIGANVGNHTLFLGLQSKASKIIAFEPNPGAMRLLAKKISSNPRVIIHPIQMGLSDRSGQLLLSLPDHNNLGVASLEKNVGSRSVTVDVCRGDDVDEIKYSPNVTVIKVDVEGHELQVLSGLQKTLGLHHPVVFFEWKGGMLSSFRSLFPAGYTFYCVSGDENVAFFLAKQGYRLQMLRPDRMANLCNILAWPPRRPFPAKLAARLRP
jgi:FkbM family methyltransferase